MIFYISMDNFLFGTVEIKRMNLRNLPAKVQIWSYLMVFVPILCIPGYAIYKILITPGRDFDEVGASNAMANRERKDFYSSSAFNELFDRKSQPSNAFNLDRIRINSRTKSMISNTVLFSARDKRFESTIFIVRCSVATVASTARRWIGQERVHSLTLFVVVSSEKRESV